jgi:hypothetical protein
VLKPDGVPIDGMNDDVGNVDGVFGCPPSSTAPDPTFTSRVGDSQLGGDVGRGATRARSSTSSS